MPASNESAGTRWLASELIRTEPPGGYGPPRPAGVGLTRRRFVRLPNADEFDEDRRHPIHVKVHLGEPGTRNGEDVIFVQGSGGDINNCESYANA